MGYPMTYRRFIERNHLKGDYDTSTMMLPTDMGLVRGDLRRLEKNQRDEQHLLHYAELAGITPEQVKIVLDAFFGPLDKEIIKDM